MRKCKEDDFEKSKGAEIFAHGIIKTRVKTRDEKKNALKEFRKEENKRGKNSNT